MTAALSALLPTFPWDTLATARKRAGEHPDGLVDLSIGTPVDPTPECGLQALRAAANSPGYPATSGSPALVRAIIDYLERRWGAVALPSDAVLPVIGTKELVAWLPILLNVAPGDTVVVPGMAYPTYEVGALLARAHVVRCDDPAELGGVKPSLIWVNSPANPHGAVMDVSLTRAWIECARDCGALLAADECYGEFGWDAEPVSVLNPAANDGSLTGILGCYSLSKRSNAAGYRAGFVAGDPRVVRELLEVRKHAGMMVSGPVQAAMIALLGDQTHVDHQRERYLRRRAMLKPALEHAGFRIDHSEGSLYLWATRGEPCRDSIDYLAGHGILAAPGEFYGAAAARHVRVALTATDQAIGKAVARLLAT